MIVLEGNLLDTPFQFIAHQVNCRGVMGAGLAKQIRQKYPEVYEDYKNYCNTATKGYNHIGDCQVSWTNDRKHCILNIFGQLGYGTEYVQTDYVALKQGFFLAVQWIKNKYFSDYEQNYQIVIAIPYGIGCGLAGGDWEKVKKLLTEIEEECGVLFIAYRL